MISTASPTTTSTQSQFLIIGYGRELQGGDDIGPEVAMAVTDWRLSSVKSLAVHQLTPRLAVDIAKADYVIFVGACGESCAPNVQIEPIVIRKPSSPHYTAPILALSCEPSTLLTLTHALYGRHPQAWLLKIPTERFDKGKSLSDTAHQGIDRAMRAIEQFVTTYQRPQCISQMSTPKGAAAKL
ncbi:MAG: hydrogenase maturation protease [Leptolyngbyaceae cyanobacterium MO_188.B28]|nr:hydrogenase maturation protease [Leptolyngbyaceae cyanobacterium MO_188.B28]